MNVWSVLVVVAVISVLLAIIIHKIAKWCGRSENVSMYLLLFGLLFTPTSLVMGAFEGELQIQLIAAGVFLVLITICFVRIYRADHSKRNPPVASIYCTFCGAALQNGMRYCPSCGREISRHGGT